MSATLDFQKVKVRICGEKALYVSIDNWTVYLDNSTNEHIIDFWFSDKLRDQEINVNNLISENQRLKAEIAELKAKEETSIFWAVTDIEFHIENNKKYYGLKLSEEDQRVILKNAIENHEPFIGLKWEDLDFYIESFLEEKRTEN
jgi:hypothetical protein